ncbi:MAG: pseudouridylate synthase [Paludibacteraceae bacterium]|nr:pseudouridylate synthase [Paludibacteraceae bacterium]
MNNSEKIMFSEDFLRSVDVHELLPQQEPFVMIDNITYVDEVRTITETIIDEKNIFVENGHLMVAGAMENIAQTCAARLGFYNKYVLKKDVQIGFIGAVRNFEIESLPAVGDKITTTIDVLEEVFKMTLAKAAITCKGRMMIQTEMKIALKKD